MRAFFAISALAGLLVLAGCGKQLSTGMPVDSGLRKFVSADTLVLAGLDVEKIRATPFYARHQKQLDIPALNALAGQGGFDFRRDLSFILLAWNGKDMVIAGRGRFDKNKIQQQLGPGAVRSEFKGHTLFEFQGEAVAFPETEVAVAGKIHSVEKAIGIAENGSGDVPDELSSGLKKLSPADQIWLVSRGGLPFRDMPASSERRSILSNFAGYVKTTSAGITVASGLHFKAEVDCVSEAGAKRVDDGVRGGLGFARLALKNNQLDLLPLYDAVHVKQDKQTVYVDANLSAELADKLLNRLISVDVGSAPDGRR